MVDLLQKQQEYQQQREQKEFHDSIKSHSTTWRPFSTCSYDSCITDEGYHTTEDEKLHSFSSSSSSSSSNSTNTTATEEEEKEEQEKEEEEYYKTSSNDTDIPILKSNRNIQISYSFTTYTLTISIIIISIYTLFQQPFPWGHTFPPIFLLFHLSFHLIHLLAHLFNWLFIERHCVVYGTWLYWTGWLLGQLLFSQRLVAQQYHSTTSMLLFWLLMLERRNAWGIIVWEFVSKLDQDLIHQTGSIFKTQKPLKLWELGSFRLLVFRIWCLLGTGSFWGLSYIALAKMDGFQFKYLLQGHHIMKLLLVSTFGGLLMIIFWSFWTFQYRGILWQKELRKGIIVWYSEGIAHAAQVL